MCTTDLPHLYFIRPYCITKPSKLTNVTGQQSSYHVTNMLYKDVKRTAAAEIGVGNISKFSCIAIWFSIPSNTFINTRVFPKEW